MKTKRLFAFLLALVMSLGLVLPAFAEGIETDPAEIGETAEQAFGDAATLESVNNDPEPHRANLEDGYYLIGLNGWTVDDINAKDKLTQNPGNASEYWIKTTVAVGQEFKVAHIVDGQIGDDGWMYGAGDGNGNYRITSDTPSGAVTIYFRNTWNNDWNGHIYVAQNYDLTIAAATNGTVDASAKQNISVGETVTLTVAPAAGYLLDSLTVDGADVTASVANGNYSFKMPGHDVTVSAQFAKIPYPTAAVVEIAPAAKNVPLYDIATQKQIGTVDELEAEYSFTPDNPTSEQITYYGLWHADYRISFNQDIAKDTFGLYGKYFGYGVNLEAAFQFPTDLKAGEEVYLLGSIGFDDAVNYNDCVNNIQEFLCGVYNLSEDNWGKTISVDLVIWDGSDPDTRIVVSTTDYTFKGKAKLNITEAPELPKANVEKITPTEMVKIGEDDQKLEAEYKFTPVEPTAIQLAYYGGWRADYRVSMNADTAAESFGLYGAYNGYGQEFKQGFLFPVPLTANEPIQLLTSAGLSSVTYDDVVNNIGEFICGVFNKSADNVGKTFKVELIIWDENDANAEPAVLATTTYTFVNQIPPLPKASIEEITENKDTNIPVYNPSTFAETGEVVEELGAEYKFTPDPETTEAQKEYYKDWRCDYRISFNKDIAAESFGLFGAYGEFNVAFLYPEDVNESTVKYLLRDFGLDAKLTYKEVLNNVQQFKCGAFNLSDDNLNQGKWMKVELVMFAPDQTAEDSVVIATDYYYFGDKTNLVGPVPELPKADVEKITAETVKINGEDVKLEAEYQFTPVQPTEAQLAYYGNWYADYRVSMDAATTKETFGLYGEYDGYGTHFAQGFLFPQALTANEPVMLLELANLSGVTYNDMVKNIGEFICGVFNKSDDNLGKTFKVELVIWNPAEPETKYVISTTKYTFEKPELPEANVKSITPATVEIDGESVVLEAEYEFTPVEPTEAQLAYYGNWYADYRVSMDADTTKETFGLYGEYDGYGTHFAQGFLFPQDLAKDETVQLLEMLDLTGVTYNDVVNNIGKFTCGVFNKSDENLGKTFTVELIIWNPADPDTKYVIATTTYTFRKMYTLTLTSQDTDGNTNIAMLTGGGQFESGTEVTVTAPNDVAGFTFDGWYKDSYDPENKVAGTYAYTFTIEADTALVAVYKNNLSMGLLHVKGSTYKVNDGELQTSNNDFDIPIGDKVTLVYTGEDFLYWVNISDNIVSTSPTYNFTMVDETTLRLITSRNMEQNASAYAVFLNAYSQVQSEGRVTDAQGAEELFPKNNPSKIGVTFEKWVFEGTDEEATPDSIAARIAVPAPVVKIVPKYKAPEETYTLTVKYRNNGTEGDVEGYTELAIVSGKTKTIALSTIIDKVGGLDAESFSYWTLDGTTPVSFDKTGYMVVATKGKTITLTAVFGEEKEPEPIVRIEQMTATMNGEKYRVSTMMRYEVPEGYIVHESGFVRSTSGEFTDETLVIGAENTKKHISNFTVQSAVYVLNINFTDPGKVVYYKAYIIYEKDGQLFTQYSAMESGSYNQLTD